MQFFFSGHYIDDYNGLYTALDFFNVDYWTGNPSRYIHFKNTNEMFLYYFPLDGETEGVWYLTDNENLLYDYGGNMYSCSTYMCLFYQAIVLNIEPDIDPNMFSY